MKKILKNYKTTVPAVLIGLGFVLQHLGVLTPEQVNAGMTVLTALGLAGAKDFDHKEE